MIKDPSRPYAKKRNSGEVVAVIPAAGSGTRMGTDTPKQFLTINGKPLLAFTLEAFEKASLIDAVILVVPGPEIKFCRENVILPYGFKKIVSIVPGGKRRQDSVKRGIEATAGKYRLVVIHDGVRPFAEPELINRVIREARKHRAAIAGIPARDTIKVVNPSKIIEKTLERQAIWLAQTPQAFFYEDIARAHERAVNENWGELTDDAAFVEKMGISVKMVMGSERNIKVTTPADLELAKLFIQGE